MLIEYIASSFEEYGFWFSIRTYWAYVWESGIYVFFLTALFFFFCSRKEDVKNIWLVPFMILLLTIYNPFVLSCIFLILEKFGLLFGAALYGAYQRMYALMPFHIIIAWVMVDVVKNIGNKGKKVICVVILFLAIPLVGDMTFLEKYVVPENEDYVSDEVIQICDILHDNSARNEVRVMVLHSIYRATIRQYDASIIIPDDYMCIDFPITFELVDDEVKDMDCEFVVMPKGSEVNVILQEADYEILTETESCIIYITP